MMEKLICPKCGNESIEFVAMPDKTIYKCSSCGYETELNNYGEETEAKFDTGKPRPTLVPVAIIKAITSVREYGVQKYHDPENWRKVSIKRYRDALYRHWLAYLDGEEVDPESGLPHTWHMAANLDFIIELEDGDPWKL